MHESCPCPTTILFHRERSKKDQTQYEILVVKFDRKTFQETSGGKTLKNVVLNGKDMAIIKV